MYVVLNALSEYTLKARGKKKMLELSMWKLIETIKCTVTAVAADAVIFSITFNIKQFACKYE